MPESSKNARTDDHVIESESVWIELKFSIALPFSFIFVVGMNSDADAIAIDIYQLNRKQSFICFLLLSTHTHTLIQNANVRRRKKCRIDFVVVCFGEMEDKQPGAVVRPLASKGLKWARGAECVYSHMCESFRAPAVYSTPSFARLL